MFRLLSRVSLFQSSKCSPQTSRRRSKAPFEGEAFGHRRQPDEVDHDHPGPFLLFNIDDGEADANRLLGFQPPYPRSPVVPALM